MWSVLLHEHWELSSARLERQTVNLDVGGSNPSVPVTIAGGRSEISPSLINSEKSVQLRCVAISIYHV